MLGERAELGSPSRNMAVWPPLMLVLLACTRLSHFIHSHHLSHTAARPRHGIGDSTWGQKFWVTQEEGCSWGSLCPFTIWYLAPALPALKHSTPILCHLLSGPAKELLPRVSLSLTKSSRNLQVWGRQSQHCQSWGSGLDWRNEWRRGFLSRVLKNE